MKELPTIALRAGLQAAANVAGTTIEHNWKIADKNIWYATFSVHLNASKSAYLPKVTRWCVVATKAYPNGSVVVYPAKDGGISHSFWHQAYNSEGHGKYEGKYPWRSGQICLQHPYVDFGRLSDVTQPYEEKARLAWVFNRTREWCGLAASDNLAKDGAPFELPLLPAQSSGIGSIAFQEIPDNLSRWLDTPVRQGIVHLKIINNSYLVWAAHSFEGIDGRVIHAAPWSQRLKSISDKGLIGFWILLDQMPVDPPWGYPRRWEDLYSHCLSERTNLYELLQSQSHQIRDGLPHPILLGFPVPENIGSAVNRIHWASVELPVIHTKKKAKERNHRPNEANYLRLDNQFVRHPKKSVFWVPSRNWSEDQIRRRGHFSEDFSSKRICLIGAGAVGSALAEQLVRGGANVSSVVDEDTIQIGNLSRHILTIADVARAKSHALAERLSSINPIRDCKPFDEDIRLPSNSLVEHLRDEVDIIVECTGSDQVLVALKSLDLGMEKEFFSVSTGFKAQRLYVHAARGTSFPLESFREHYSPWLPLELAAAHDSEVPWEGIGCWNPLVPALGADVSIMSSIAAKFIASHSATRYEEMFRVWELNNADSSFEIREAELPSHEDL